MDPRSDIYSVGVLIYEMLAGKAPFARDKQVQILMDHINSPVPAIAAPEGSAPIPDDLAQVVHKCLEKDPAARFANMEQLMIALKLIAGQHALSMPPGFDSGTLMGSSSSEHPIAAPESLVPSDRPVAVSGVQSVSAIHDAATALDNPRLPGVSVARTTPPRAGDPPSADAGIQVTAERRSRTGPIIVVGILAATAALVVLALFVIPAMEASRAPRTVPLETTRATPTESDPIAAARDNSPRRTRRTARRRNRPSRRRA